MPENNEVGELHAAEGQQCEVPVYKLSTFYSRLGYQFVDLFTPCHDRLAAGKHTDQLSKLSKVYKLYVYSNFAQMNRKVVQSTIDSLLKLPQSADDLELKQLCQKMAFTLGMMHLTSELMSSVGGRNSNATLKVNVDTLKNRQYTFSKELLFCHRNQNNIAQFFDKLIHWLFGGKWGEVDDCKTEQLSKKAASLLGEFQKFEDDQLAVSQELKEPEVVDDQSTVEMFNMERN